uniref:Uncharacterized protein n=1 Tax=Romanomermis culicivorax TaxID=13658 RepID=A0A915I5F6_ROMCU
LTGFLICGETTKQIAQTFGGFLRSTAKFDFKTYDNENFNFNDVVIRDDRIVYLIDQDCQICLTLDTAEKNVAAQMLESQLNKKRKEFIFNSNRLKNFTRFKKTVHVEQERRLTQTIADIKAEIQRLDDLYNLVAKCR